PPPARPRRKWSPATAPTSPPCARKPVPPALPQRTGSQSDDRARLTLRPPLSCGDEQPTQPHRPRTPWPWQPPQSSRTNTATSGGELQVSDESLEVRWVPADELDDLPIHHTQRLRVRHYREHRKTPYLG